MKKECSIFIADKNEVDRFLLQSQLEPYCKNIYQAADGKEVLSCLKQHQYDLIFLDVHMPFFNCLEDIKVIKEAESINNDSAVIAITKFVEQQKIKILINAGYDECLIKPILLPEITEILNLWLVEPSRKDSEYMQAILEKTGGNRDLAKTILNKLFVEFPQQVLIIENALKANDYKLAKKITHKLHGSVSLFEFLDIKEIAYALENSLSDNGALIDQHFLALKKHINYFLDSKSSL